MVTQQADSWLSKEKGEFQICLSELTFYIFSHFSAKTIFVKEPDIKFDIWKSKHV